MRKLKPCIHSLHDVSDGQVIGHSAVLALHDEMGMAYSAWCMVHGDSALLAGDGRYIAPEVLQVNLASG